MGKAGVQRYETHGRPAIGLFGDSPRNVFAFGPHELVLHFDGDRWTEEHASARAAHGGADLLQAAYYLPDQPRPRLIAFGPHLALERHEDGHWTTPQEPERHRLELLGGIGPPERPPGCRSDTWLWMGRSLAFVACQDRRAFAYDSGQFTLAGKVPASCSMIARAALSKHDLYLVCANKTLWSIEGQTWLKLEPPRDKDDDYFSISVADDCVFLTARHSVWRKCLPPRPPQ